MAKRRPIRQRAVLQYPAHRFRPEELLTFIELSPFSRRWRQLKLDDVALAILQVAIMVDPHGGDVMEDTGGLRKLRFSPPGWGGGKSGALRVCYVYFQEVGTVVLALVYAKDEKDDLDADDKKTLRRYVEQIHKKLLANTYRCRPAIDGKE